MPVEIVTNNHWRPVIPWYELTLDQRSEFDYLHWQDMENGLDYAEFVAFKGQLYYVNDFVEAGIGNSQRPEWLKGWDNYMSDSFFSGLVIRYNGDGTEVVIGTYYAK